MKIFVIGTGNVASVLSRALLKAGHRISGVYSRTPVHADKLAGALKCKPFYRAEEIPDNLDLYLIAVKDDVIEKISALIPKTKGIVVHTSGSIPLNVLKKHVNSGVIYPVESISSARKISFKKVPFCLEASNETSLKKIFKLTSALSEHIYILNSRQRAALHLSAVFTNNFTNYLLTIAESILQKEGLPVELLYPLASSTINNAFNEDPAKAQTGPARRNDQVTIKNHLKYLKNNKEYSSLYKLLTRQIVSRYKKS